MACLSNRGSPHVFRSAILLLNLALCWQANLVIELTNELCLSFSISAGIFISTEGLYFLLICFIDFMFVHGTAISGDNPSISSKCEGADWTSCSSSCSLRRCDNSYKSSTRYFCFFQLQAHSTRVR